MSGGKRCVVPVVKPDRSSSVICGREVRSVVSAVVMVLLVGSSTFAPVADVSGRG